jgi:hypothetical protein
MCANDFSSVKVGDKLWSVQLGECDVVVVKAGTWNSIVCRNGEGNSEPYHQDGRYWSEDAAPSLYWSRPEITAPPKPKRMVRKEVEAWVNVYDGMHIVDSSMMFKTRDAADVSGTCRIACVRLTGSYEVEE